MILSMKQKVPKFSFIHMPDNTLIRFKSFCRYAKCEAGEEDLDTNGSL